ncbi:hypothetical protein [Niallia sp. BSM11]|uniref:hypothetical protein n=1 Tax=Niallia sp. BSM11 TaxID=3391576 RepID=UPI00398474BE
MAKFKSSINVMYDIGQSDLFEQFVPNVNQIDILNSILKGILDDEHKAHLMVGPYGAGKSMVGALTASLISARKNSKDVKDFLHDVNTVSPESYESLNETLNKKEVKWIPVAITGKSGDFDQIILEAVINQIKEHNISISLKGDGEHILKMVSLWQREYPVTYKRLDEYCNRLNILLPEMLTQIKLGDEEYIVEFKKMYPHLTSGAMFLSENNVPFIEQLEYILKQLKTKKIGIFLVYDEFGRFLQTVNQSSIYQTMQGLQDLAEISNRISNLGLLFITHTGLRQYASSNNNLSKSELERVEKRFLDHRLESDSALFYRSAFKILESVRSVDGGNLFLVEDIDYLRSEILKYNLFPDMTSTEVEGAILEGCQPIHPLTIRLLPTLSNILGQNERTLYTFLADSERTSEISTWFYADQLFDYFYPDESTFYLIEDLRFYRMAMSYGLNPNAKRIVKIVTLINIANRPFAITKAFLQFALGLSLEAVERALSELTNSKLIRFNRFANSFELYSGSLVEFENIFNEFKQSTIINDTRRIEYIDRIFLNKYYLPLAYNSDKSMTRFIEAKFSWKEQLSTLNSAGDGVLVYVLYRSNEEFSQVVKTIKEEKKANILFCIPSLDVELLQEKIDQYIVLYTLLDNKELLQQDENLKSEIEIRIESIKYDIEQILQPLQKFDQTALKWIFDGEELPPFESKENLESFLSNWMYKRFPHTLEVRNEGFNKSNVTSMQKKAAITVLSELISPTFNGEFSFSGFGPDYLIYATLLKNQAYNFNRLDQLDNKQLVLMRKHLKEFVQQHPRGKFTDLYKILLREPFGMREPLVPILVTALLKDYWDQMAFYANDFYVSQMNADLMYQIIEQNVDFYEYEIYELSSETINTLKLINEAFFDGRLTVQPVVLFNELTSWLRKLPRITQITSMHSSDILLFKEIIRHSETDPLEAATRIGKLLKGSGIQELLQIKNILENHLSKTRKVIEETVLDTWFVEKWDEWEEQNQSLIKENPILAETIKKVNNAEDWLNYLIEKTVGVNLKDWSDITYDSFISAIKQLTTLHEDAKVVKIVTGDQTVMKIKEVDMSIKGKTIYSNVSRIVQNGGRTISPDEVKYIMYKILSELNS